MHHWPAITESVHAQILSDSRVPLYNLCNIQNKCKGSANEHGTQSVRVTEGVTVTH